MTKQPATWLVVIVFGATLAGSAQMPPDVPFAGSKMTRQQVLDTLTSATPGTKVDKAKGKELFEKLCAGCHIFGDIGMSVGPDLTTLASRFGRKDTLEAIMWPSKTISDQYTVTMFELNDGRLIGGVIVREDARAVYIKNADYLERPLPMLLNTIKERTESTVSLMPENLMAELSLDDIDSMVTYVLGAQ